MPPKPLRRVLRHRTGARPRTAAVPIRAVRVLICGSRRYRNAEAIARYVAGLPSGTVVIHGDAPGADSLADQYARQNGLTPEPYPADWDRYGRGAGPVRNKQMLDKGKPTRVAAFVSDPTNSPGTANIVLQSLARGLPVTIFD